MLDTTKCVLNGLNQIKYLKSRDRVHFADIPSNEGESNNQKFVKGTINTIDSLETINKVSNLKVFMKNYAKLRWRRFWFLSLPASLAALSILTFLPPKRIPATKSIPLYEKTETLYNSNYGESTTVSEGYVYNDSFSSFRVHGAENVFDNEDFKNYINLQLFNPDDYIDVKFNIDANGLITVYSINTGEYFDFTDYSDIEFDDSTDKYDQLFEKLVQVVKDSGRLTDESFEKLNRLTEDEKKTVVILVQKYVNKGEVFASGTKSKTALHVILAFMLVISGAVSGFYYDDKGKEAFRFRVLENVNGELYERYIDEVNLYLESIKYKEAYLAAEKERILKLEEEIKKNIAAGDQGKLLTRYEKKIISKAKKDEENSLKADIKKKVKSL